MSLSEQIDAQLAKLKNILDNKVPEFNKMANRYSKPPLDINVKDE